MDTLKKNRLMVSLLVVLASMGVAEPVAAATLVRLQGLLKPGEELLGYLEGCGERGYGALLASSVEAASPGDSSRLVVWSSEQGEQSISLDENFEQLVCHGDFLVASGESGSALNVLIMDLRGAQPMVSLRERSQQPPVFLRRGDDVLVALVKQMRMPAGKKFLLPSDGDVYKFEPANGRFRLLAHSRWSKLEQYGSCK
ncbi:hypothetical protein D187_008467 [Cystobacter fuscus DSM 2262]|uniref:Lipoprotein n=1 Tax=Cystobacter fuscus (strain ATCC 25194 / DSM 2262 / NBRC 100088 / M29) TaxID=1242864 RepID=S9PD14_CYSF2|nr:hypothetical protein [Cystobacter fuscus]EPX62280.1 hypothetical protein D187_008467 [Cystobacter fuscus DSM 2262]